VQFNRTSELFPQLPNSTRRRTRILHCGLMVINSPCWHHALRLGPSLRVESRFPRHLGSLPKGPILEEMNLPLLLGGRPLDLDR